MGESQQKSPSVLSNLVICIKTTQTPVTVAGFGLKSLKKNLKFSKQSTASIPHPQIKAQTT